MDHDAAGAEAIAEAIVQDIGHDVDYGAVETDRARRAAALIAETL